MRKTTLMILMVLISSINYAQNCDCSSNFKWLIETFEKNDAGFQYIVDKKGDDYYSYFTKEKLKEAQKINTIFECKDLMNEWLSFFRKGHIGVTLNNQRKRKKIEKLYDTLNINHQEFREYLKKEEISRFEGIWDISPYFTIGIIADKNSMVRENEYVRKYIGFIVNSNTSSWEINQIKLEIFKSQIDDTYMMKYYTGDHSLQRFNSIVFLDDNFIKSGFIFLEKTFPKPANPISKLEIKSMINQFPFVSEISNNTMYLRIPTFNIQHKKLIDSVIISNFDKLTSHKNLIIDIRNNGGGSDLSYQKILPLLYTNPIRTVQVEYLSTELNLKPCLHIANDNTSDKETRKFCKTLSEKMKNNPNKFVSFSDNIVDEQKFDTIYKYPNKVAILINKNCSSSAEQFVYEARQSYKVKLFGTSTFGAIDISNMGHLVFSTDSRFTLWYSISKTYRIPDLIADDIGFPPDYYYDKTIKPYEWIDKTIEILNYK